MHQEYYHRLKRLKGVYLNYFLAGFVDGEGSFNVSFSRHKDLKSGWIINTKFQAYQHEKESDILEVLQDVLHAGRIRKKAGSNVLVLSIESRQTQIEKVIPFFQSYPLATKQKVFEQWKKIVLMLSRGEHLNQIGYKKIVEMAYYMNQQGKGRKWTKDDLNERISLM